MKAKIVVTPKLRAGKSDSGVQNIATPMLMLAKFSGMNLSTDLNKLLAGADGRISDELSSHGFKGEVGENLTIALGEKSLQKRVLVVGLGKAGNFDCSTVRETMKVAVTRAVEARCERLTIPIMPNRLTSSTLGYMSTAYIIKCVAEDVLDRQKGDGVLEIELVVSPQAKRHVDAGLAKQRRSGGPCAKAKTHCSKKEVRK